MILVLDDEIETLVKNNKYLNHGKELASLNLWIVCDPDTEKGRKVLSDAIDFHVRVKNLYFSFI